MSTLAESRTKLATINGQGKAPKRGAGNMVFAGLYWPPEHEKGNSLIYHDVRYAIQEARKLAVQGYLAANAACSGQQKFAPQMRKWFGVREAINGPTDWWKGARDIIGTIEKFLTSNLNLYYRGSVSLIGKPTDYPGEFGNIDADDVGGLAESDTDVQNNIIGLCSDFFTKTNRQKRSSMALKGFDSVGGTIVHELSHNLCGTDDHDYNGGDCYGTANCQGLAIDEKYLAWWNADNIEYFCEEVAYGVTAATTIATGATSSVSSLKAKFGG